MNISDKVIIEKKKGKIILHPNNRLPSIDNIMCGKWMKFAFIVKYEVKA